MNKKSLLMIAAVSVILGAGALGVHSVSAQETTDAVFVKENAMSDLVQKIATKFNLNESEVKAVFDEAHEERHAKMQAQYEAKLSEAVKVGKLTEAQKQLVLQKHAELQASRESRMEEMHNKTPEEMKETMKAEKAELEAWAKENGIDMQYLMGGKGGPKIGIKHF